MPSLDEARDASLTSKPCVSEAKKPDASLTSDYSINFYRAGVSSRSQQQYARLSYRQGNRVKHVHIPGGNVTSSLMRKRLALLDWSKKMGAPLSEVLRIIGTWKS